MPALEEFYKILRRNPDLDEDLFAWYWETLMYVACGNAKVWNEYHRYYGNLSTFSPPDKPNKPYVTSATEAFAVLILDNCEIKWPLLLKLERENTGKIIYQKSAKENTIAREGITVINLEQEPDFKGKYTVPDSGSVDSGGWTSAGIGLFIKYRGWCDEARRKPTTKAIEDKILLKLQSKRGIQGNTWEDEQALKGKKDKKSEELDIELDQLYKADDFGGVVFPV